jgi:hypothetical protein
LNAFHHYELSHSPFEILLHQIPKHKRNQVSKETLQSSFLLLDSLFHSTTSFEINETNISSLFVLSNLLDNPHLHHKCENYFKDHPQTFSFSCKQLRYLPQHDRSTFNNLEIHVHEHVFNTNQALYSLLSDSLFHLDSIPTEITLSLPNEQTSCFNSFLSILEGIPMNLLKFETDLLFSFFEKVGCSTALSFLSTRIKIPETLEESLHFLHSVHYPFSNIFNDHFQQSISILAQNLKHVLFDQLDLLSFDILELIFSNEHLQVPDEDFIFQIICKLIHSDPHRKRLYRFVHLCNVSNALIEQEFSEIEVEDIDHELLEIIKTRLFKKLDSSSFIDFPTRYEHASTSKKIELHHYQGIITSLRSQNSDFVSVDNPHKNSSSEFFSQNQIQ